jgi:hypothetical protein
MARTPLTDFLQNYAFWLIDIGPQDNVGVPLLFPLLGFSAITSPEYTIETFEIAEGNALASKKAIKKASASNITLSRGVPFYDSDFFRWTITALTGDTTADKFLAIPRLEIGGPSYRRNLLLIQYFPHLIFFKSDNPENETLAKVGNTILGLSTTLNLAGTTGALEGSGAAFLASAGTLTAAGTALAAAGIGPFELAQRVPARSWLLKGCIPTRYKATSDFDALSGAVGIAELELAVEFWEEISLSV